MSASISARFLAPLVCGTLGETAGWHYGFAAAGIGMLTGLAIYLYASPMLPPDRITPVTERTTLTRDDRRTLGALLLLFVPTSFFWATYEQQGNTIALWADTHTDRAINLLGWSAEIPTTSFQAFNPFMIFAFTPLVVGLWAWQANRGSEPATLTKMALGCFGVTLANLIMAARRGTPAAPRRAGCGCSAISSSSRSASSTSRRSGSRWCRRSRRPECCR